MPIPIPTFLWYAMFNQLVLVEFFPFYHWLIASVQLSACVLLQEFACMDEKRGELVGMKPVYTITYFFHKLVHEFFSMTMFYVHIIVSPCSRNEWILFLHSSTDDHWVNCISFNINDSKSRLNTSNWFSWSLDTSRWLSLSQQQQLMNWTHWMSYKSYPCQSCEINNPDQNRILHTID